MPKSVACLDPSLSLADLNKGFFVFLPELDSTASTLSKKLSLFCIDPLVFNIFVVFFRLKGFVSAEER